MSREAQKPGLKIRPLGEGEIAACLGISLCETLAGQRVFEHIQKAAKMEITRISEENRAFFDNFIPKELMKSCPIKYGVILDGTAVGVLAAQVTTSSAEVEWLFITEDWRRMGAGHMLMKEIKKEASKSGIDILFLNIINSPDTEDLHSFLAHEGFSEGEERTPVFRCLLKDFAFPEKRQESRSSVEGYYPVSNAPSFIMNQLNQSVKELSGYDDSTIPINERFSPHFSYIKLNGNELGGYVLVHEFESGLTIEYLKNLEQDNPQVIINLLSLAYQAAKSKKAPDTPVLMNALIPTVEKLIERFSNGKAEKIGEAVSWYFPVPLWLG